MYTCQYCDLTATFAYRINASVSQFYCSFHVPSFLKSKLYIGRLVRIEELDLPAPTADTPKKGSKKKAAPVEEPVVAEETPDLVEEPIAEPIDIIVEEPVVEETGEGTTDGTD